MNGIINTANIKISEEYEIKNLITNFRYEKDHMGCGNGANCRILYTITASNVKQHVLSVNKPFYDGVKKDDFSINSLKRYFI